MLLAAVQTRAFHIYPASRWVKAGDAGNVGMQGAAVYVPEKEALIWKIKSFPGGREFLLRCKFGLPSVAAEEEAHGRMPPMRVSFEIPYFTVSGIQARHGLPEQ